MSEYQLSLVATRDSSLQGTGGCTSPRHSNFSFQSLTDFMCLAPEQKRQGTTRRDDSDANLFYVLDRCKFKSPISKLNSLAKNKVHSTKNSSRRIIYPSMHTYQKMGNGGRKVGESSVDLGREGAICGDPPRRTRVFGLVTAMNQQAMYGLLAGAVTPGPMGSQGV